MSTDNFNNIISTTAVNLSTDSSDVLLQTAFAKTTNEKGCHFEKVRILFNSGSQRSYSDEHVRKKLSSSYYVVDLYTQCKSMQLNSFKAFPPFTTFKISCPICRKHTCLLKY